MTYLIIIEFEESGLRNFLLEVLATRPDLVPVRTFLLEMTEDVGLI